MKRIKCPVCGELVELEEGLDVNEIVYCTECDRDLKLVQVNPYKLKELEDSLSNNDDEDDYEV